MQTLSLHITWIDLIVRLLLTLVAGALIGFNREEYGKFAGLRTTILVCLAASIAMIQANMLMTTIGRTQDSFVVFDIMRLPLGILSGVGFIGGGVILHRKDGIQGLTTATTLWVVTIIGLTFGGGQLFLGVVATCLTIFVLDIIQRIEGKFKKTHKITLLFCHTIQQKTNEALETAIKQHGINISNKRVVYLKNHTVEHQYDLCWNCQHDFLCPPEFIEQFAMLKGVEKIEWRPQGMFAI
jgi:putative Mg2+ transporter-C (MgtC) family protein